MHFIPSSISLRWRHFPLETWDQRYVVKVTCKMTILKRIWAPYTTVYPGKARISEQIIQAGTLMDPLTSGRIDFKGNISIRK